MEHVEQRPTWDCRACGKDWPCDPAREQLAGEMGPAALRMHQWMRLEIFAEDHPRTPVGEMFDRFMRWAH